MRHFLLGMLRAAAYVAVIGVVLAALVAASAWYLLPRLENYKPQVERLVSHYLGQRITIARLDGGWQGLDVTLRASGVRVAVGDHPGSGMRFGQMLLSFDPISVFRQGRTFERLELKGPTIEAARLADGRIRVGDTIIGTPRGTLRRLLQGRNLVITDGTLVWRDAMARGEDLSIENVDVHIRSRGGGRRFEFTASAPQRLLGGFRGSGRYDPQLLGAGTWTAEVDVALEHLDLAGIPAIIQEQLPWQSRGSVDAGIRAEWVRGELVKASAELTARDFVIPYARDRTPLAATRFASTVSWQRSAEEWRLVFAGPEIVLDDGTTVSVARFELERRDDVRTYSASEVNLQDLLGVVGRMDIELPWQQLIDRLHPRGDFSHAALTLTGPYLEARDWRFEGDFREVGWRPQARYPGVQGLDGHLTADADRGALSLDTSDLVLEAPRSLRRPVTFERVAGSIEWYRWGGDWVVDVGDGDVANGDLHLTDMSFYTRVRPDGTTSPYLLARLRVPRADIAALRDYLPVNRMTAKQTNWFERALAGGRLSDGRFYLNGPLEEFPFDGGGGELQASARVSGGILDFHEKWPDLEGLEGVLELDNARFEARVRRGSMMSSPIDHARIWSDDFFRRDRTLFIQGGMTAEAADVVHFLRRGPLIKNPPPDYSTMSASGSGNLAMTIELPFTRLKEESRVQGDYQFDDVAVEVADGIEFTRMAGSVRFTEQTVEGEDLTGILMGGEVTADVVTVDPGRPMRFAISGTGRTDVSRLEPVIGPVITSRLDGSARWQARFVGGPGTNELDVSSDLQGVEILFPAPLWKAAGASGGIDVHVDFDRGSRRVAVDLADRLGGELHYAREAGRAVLQRGVLNLGGARALPEQELAISVRGPGLDIDQWIDEVQQLRRFRERIGDADPERDMLFEHLRSLDVDVDNLRYLHRDLGPTTIRASSSDSRDWRARLDGDRVAGEGRLRLDLQPARYVFDLARLHWPRLQKGARATSYKTPPEPGEFAHVAVDADEFRFGDMRLGRLEFRAGPRKNAWLIEKLSLQQPALGLEASGSWTADQFGAHHTSVEVTATTDELGEALVQLGLGEQVANGEADVDAGLNWSGEPGDFALGKLNGALTFNAEDGRFLKVEPGSGRLLGLFNIETITRRLKLDFTDVFKEGLAFDRINGEAGITAGRLHTDGIFIIGPAALLELDGATDLGDETYDLEVTVAPQLGGNLSLAGAIANPAAGAMIFVMQRLFKKQMAKLIHYRYSLTGPWSDPEVTSLKQESSDEQPQGGLKP